MPFGVMVQPEVKLRVKVLLTLDVPCTVARRGAICACADSERSIAAARRMRRITM